MVEDKNIFLEYVLNSDGLPSSETIATFKNWDFELERWAETIKKNPIVKDLDNFLKKEIHSTEISDEERDKLYLRYLEMRLALFDRSVELAKTFARPDYPFSISRDDDLDDEIGLTLFEIDRQIKTRQVSLLDEQIAGFEHDMSYKAAKTLSENSAMLAQADQATPEWMADSIKILIEMMTRGKLNLKIVSGETEVNYNPTDGDYSIGLSN